jgi:hypothetical protein
MPDLQHFIIAPDKRAQGTAADLAAFLAAARAHPEVSVVKEGLGFATISAVPGVVDALMASHGEKLMRAVDAALQMPEPPGPFSGQTILQAPKGRDDADPSDDGDDNFL